MTAREARIGLMAFALLVVGLGVNLIALQGPSGASRLRGERSTVGTVDKADKARRLALPILATQADKSGVTGISTGTDAGETVRAIQRELHTRGYPTGATDGTPGLMTQAAIMAFEHDHGLPLSAEPDEQTLKTILLGGAAGATKVRPGRSASAEAVIKTVQQTLSGLGYNIGKVDGRIGEDTQRAIREFETDHQMPETGRISGALIARLAKAAGGGRLPGTR